MEFESLPLLSIVEFHCYLQVLKNFHREIETPNLFHSIDMILVFK